MSDPNPGEFYVGDGLYASYDGFGLKLAAPRDGVMHWVYLEPEVLAQLLGYLGSKMGGTFILSKDGEGG